MAAPKEGGTRADWIRFRVVEAKTYRPLSSVQVRIYSVDRSSKGSAEVFFFSKNFEGKRELLLPPPPRGGTHWVLEFRRKGYLDYQQEYRDFLEMKKELDETQPFEIFLAKGHPFSGRVLGPGGRPVGGAELYWVRKWDLGLGFAGGAFSRTDLEYKFLEYKFPVWTDPEGAFQMEGLDDHERGGLFSLFGRRKRLGSGSLGVASPWRGRVLPPLLLGEGKSLRGRLLHLDGTPVSGIPLMVRLKNFGKQAPVVGSLRAFGTSDKQGNFVFKRLDGKAPYELWAFLPLREKGRNRGSLAVLLDPALVPKEGAKTHFLQKVQVELGVKRSGSGGKIARPSLLLKVSGNARSRAQLLVWHPSGDQGRARISLPPGRVLELKAMASEMLLSQKTVTIQGGSGLQRIHLDLSLPRDLVKVRFLIKHPNPGPNRFFSLKCEVQNPLRSWGSYSGWGWRPYRSLGQGVYEVQLLPGLQRGRMHLMGPYEEKDLSDGPPPRILLPKRISYPYWFPFDKKIRIGQGGNSQFSWVPRPCSRLYFSLKDACHGKEWYKQVMDQILNHVSLPKDMQTFKNIRIQRLGLLSGSGYQVLDQVHVASKKEIRYLLYKPDLSPGRHRFRLKAEGYAPEEVEVLLPSQIDQVVTVSLKRNFK
ncbi:MAG TPA: hypothetical protein ENK02_14515 [Planctomycetes bacterium]|nr:hypothetical protein [Planctomycetota bacterium]